ncbi:phage integrase Arm DNA-binding domain-containing protein [Acinetobacter sp. NIPH 1852]|uniref:phage integrase Arm DNA-binding domain-containing protein n=1 Tax=Acinetobacter sp. NIPH 1852 TaxID=2923428 RepID=UPI001F4BA677|nr:phage integrase Arm DNA-binding domain-containing protein [Acinetobacter sp. NIPH 1852]MCH7308382.1 phage integrase Arm DNA-binding domain-containing protein [Acinetobacter sp. NIPH 1852]
MTPRPRGKGSLDLPPHVEIDKKSNGTIYYRYMLPNGQRKSLGKDRNEAIVAAMALNAALDRHPDIVAKILESNRKVTTNIPNFEDGLKEFLQLRLSEKTYAKSTLTIINANCDKYIETWGSIYCNEITLNMLATYLKEQTPFQAEKHRSLLIDIFKYFVANGWANDNIAEKTLKPIRPKKTRQRLSNETLAQIRAVSPDWLKYAIDLALHSTQRRGDLVALLRTAVNVKENTFTVLQHKSLNYDKQIYIEVDMHPELAEAVVKCLENSFRLNCPYLIATRPVRITAHNRAVKLHAFAVTEDHLTKQFQKYRDLSGACDHLEPRQRPSFHDLRALGIFNITEKYGKAYAQALAGHATEKMTDHYLQGHEEPKPQRVSFR